MLAIILRIGSKSANVIELAHQLLAKFQGLAGIDRAAVAELCRHPGLGPAKAVQLKAAFELGRRLSRFDVSALPSIHSPEDMANLVRSRMEWLEQEHLWVMMLDTKNRVVAEHQLYRGSLNLTTVRVGELFKEAIRQNAANVILVHNHPSGDVTPSADDVQLTREARQAGSLLDIEVLDHVIIGRGQPGFTSLRERGLGFDGRSRG